MIREKGYEGLILPMLRLRTKGSRDKPNAKPRTLQCSGISKALTVIDFDQLEFL